MKAILLLLTLSCFTCCAFTQAVPNKADDLKFDQRFTNCERKWVVISKADTAASYTFGYIYINEQAGFTFDLQGVFTVDNSGNYIKDTVVFKNSGSIKYRISPNWRVVALLPESHFKELHIEAQPEWVKNYYNYTDTVAHNYRWGWIYNDLNESGKALTYLLPANQAKPHMSNIEFEIAFAYNVLKRYNDAVILLEDAIKNNPDFGSFYKELGYAYLKLSDYKKAIPVFIKAIEMNKDKQSETRGELAINLAAAYKNSGDNDNYNTWMKKAKEYTPVDSPFYKLIADAGF
ncbi:tetratricopeptide repeat protein [Mucilaginibacter segetis]|uniref:Tetratricopeptide repeat protein n=1 Tax=Mucilaginibacter segetis TaxID=2793071 RepID=A0A934ULC3_9SPHI|nr:hypothetical protein [Mucilaginibacter segetis]MBK0377751.1 hypothetical protein [Mucilaginibacter segetis]